MFLSPDSSIRVNTDLSTCLPDHAAYNRTRTFSRHRMKPLRKPAAICSGFLFSVFSVLSKSAIWKNIQKYQNEGPSFEHEQGLIILRVYEVTV